MQQAVTLQYQGRTLRGMAHFPGDGEPLPEHPVPAAVLFHGFTGNKLEPHRLFLKISRTLADMGWAVFRFDFSGSGESDGNFEEMTLSGELAEAGAMLDVVRNHLSVDPQQIALIGLSMGGLVASLLAAQRADQVSRLVLMAPAGNIRHIAMDMAARAGMPVPDEVPEEVPLHLRQALATAIPAVFDMGGNLVGREFGLDLLNLRPYTQAAGYVGPVLLLHGTRDEAVPYQVSLQYQEACYGPVANVHLVEGADHTFNSAPWEAEVLTAIQNFLS
ncbi:alpha/beta fold hydrolase [Alicyclobacillaceae bacterium I2511]|nr:alpha/beta fold hydrolase [Alicyclobacillaceae bacterium I2511]